MSFYTFFLLMAYFGMAKAETYYVLVDGGSSKLSNREKYHLTLKNGYEVLTRKAKKVLVCAKNGEWTMTESHPTFPPISAPAKSGDDLMKALKTLNLSSADKIVFFMTGHGGAPQDEGGAKSSTYSYWGKNESWENFGRIIESLPKGVSTKIFTETCYGGGVHHLSRKFSNVCSSSLGTFFNSTATSPSGSRFSRAVWSYIDKNSNYSFAKLVLKGFSADVANTWMTSLSSFDYVDFILKKGPYKKNYPHSTYDVNNRPVFKIPDDFHRAIPLEKNINSPHNLLIKLEGTPKNSCVASGVEKLAEGIGKLEVLLKDLVQSSYDQMANSQYPKMRTIFHDVIIDMKNNGAKYLVQAKEYDKKFKKLKKRWDIHLSKFKDSGVISKWWYEEGRTRARIQKEYDDLRKSAERDLARFSFNQQMLDRLAKLEDFNKVATPEQKKKFIQILQCEWEPLS